MCSSDLTGFATEPARSGLDAGLPAIDGLAAAAMPGGVRPMVLPAAIRIKPLPQAIAELEARAIREALATTGGNKVAAARLLGIARATLYEKLAALASLLELPADA